MAMKDIPDVKYEISDCGDLLTIEQGSLDTDIVSLHKIHIKHFADLMQVNEVQEEGDARLTDHLERINQKAEQLYHLIGAIPCFPPSDKISDEEKLAEELHQLTNTALSLWGDGY